MGSSENDKLFATFLLITAPMVLYYIFLGPVSNSQNNTVLRQSGAIWYSCVRSDHKFGCLHLDAEGCYH